MELEKNPVSSASLPVIFNIGLPGISLCTTPKRFFSSVRSQRSRPKMETRVPGEARGYSSQLIVFSSVDLPQPFGPKQRDLLTRFNKQVDVVQYDPFPAYH